MLVQYGCMLGNMIPRLMLVTFISIELSRQGLLAGPRLAVVVFKYQGLSACQSTPRPLPSTMATWNGDNAIDQPGLAPAAERPLPAGAVLNDENTSVTSSLSTTTASPSLQTEIREALEAIPHAGTFADFAPLEPTSLVPRITVHGVGEIQLPLSEPQARRLIQDARQAPYGKGRETRVDPSVRNTWELDPSAFTVEDRAPGCELFVHTLIHRVAAMLGIPGADIKAEIYKMLIYEEGAMFKEHTK